MPKYRGEFTVCYNLGHFNFAGGSQARSIKGPIGKEGFLIDVGISVTETFACDGTTAKIRLGTTGDPDKHAELVIVDGTAITDYFNTTNDRDAIKGPNLDPETQIEVTFVNSVDSGIEAGAGDVFVVIAWS